MQYHQNYGFDLDKELSRHPIKELGNESEKSRLMESLQKGNRQAVTFLTEGSEQKHFIEANPKFKTINIYDRNLQRLNVRQSSREKQAPGETTAKQSTWKQTQNADDEGPDIPQAKKKARKRSQSIP